MNEENLLEVLEKRFKAHMKRHPNQKWSDVKQYLTGNNLTVISQMESTGGEPDCVELNDILYYIDMAAESPVGRRGNCYDKDARIKRKKFPPDSSIEEMALSMGIKVVDETMYIKLQNIEPLDQKSSSWIKTEVEMRNLNGALFGDRRFNRTFIFHNSADSYYKDRGFRGYIKLS